MHCAFTLLQAFFIQSPLASTATSLCTFTSEILSGAGCGRSELDDVCWVMSIQTSGHTVSPLCQASKDSARCARSTLQFYIYQMMDATTIPPANCVYPSVTGPAASNAPGAATATTATRLAGDLEAAFDITSDTLCGADAYGQDDGFR